jgi:hypothetical protein
VDALQVASLGGFPGDPFRYEFFSHYFSMGNGAFNFRIVATEIVDPELFIILSKCRRIAVNGQ